MAEDTGRVLNVTGRDTDSLGHGDRELPGGPTLNYREWGRPDGSVVLLLHGLTSSSQSWRNIAPVLGEQFRVIAPDARGHGGSEWTGIIPSN